MELQHNMTDRFHVLISDNVDITARQMLEDAGMRVTGPEKMVRQQVMDVIVGADGLIVRSGTRVDAELLSVARALKVIVRAGVGVDNIDLEAASLSGIVVMNTPGGNTISTAEHTMGLMLALTRHIPAAHQSLKEGLWERKLYQGFELRDKTLGIIGFGRVGQAVAARAAAFGMHIITYDPNIEKKELPEEFIFRAVELSRLYAEADIITLHPVLTEETRGMINAVSLAQMKRGVLLINSARGALIDADALADAVREGQIAGVALDVYAQEPPDADHPLIGMKEVVHTPHLAASTSDAQIAVARLAAQRIIDGLLHERFNNVKTPAVLK